MINSFFNKNWSKSTKKSIRDGYGDALVELGKNNPQVVVLTADLSESTKVDAFKKAYPDRFFDLGVAEQNLIGVGGGLAATGLIPFCSSYAMFSPGRNWDQLRNSICYSNLNLKLVSSHAGLSVGPDGATHQALEDIALTRVIPNLTVISPLDYHQAYQATLAAADLLGPIYLRLSRSASPQITCPETPFTIGLAQTLTYGQAVTLVSTGIMVSECLKAAAEIDAEVINLHTIKPLDISTIINSCKKTGKLIVVEEHQQAGGLGSAVLESLVGAGFLPPKIKLMAVPDQFGQSGTPEELFAAHGLTWEHIIQAFHDLTLIT